MALWRSYRDTALLSWSASGLIFKVEEAAPSLYPEGDWDTTDEMAWLESMVVPGKLRLMKMPSGGSASGYNQDALGDWRLGGGVTAYKMGFKFWSAVIFRRKYLIAHEFGHALGLNHRPQNEINKSVMNGKSGAWLKPDAHDLESVSRYYLGYNWA